MKRNPAVERTKEYIQNHYAEEILLQDLRKISGWSAYHLIRIFRREVGRSPHKYLVNVRIEQTKLLLIQGRPIIEIAQETGFADQSHFTRCFKTVVGITPGAFRKDWERGRPARTP